MYKSGAEENYLIKSSCTNVISSTTPPGACWEPNCAYKYRYGDLMRCRIGDNGIIFEQVLPPPDDSYKLLKSVANNIKQPQYSLTHMSRSSGFHSEYLVKPGVYSSQCGVNHGPQLIMTSNSNTNHLDEDGEFLIGQKIAGDANVPAGEVTFEINLTRECPLENMPDQYGSIEEVKMCIKETLKAKQQGRAPGSYPRPFNDKFTIYKAKYPSYACKTRKTYSVLR